MELRGISILLVVLSMSLVHSSVIETQHMVRRREANPDVNYDDDVMADAAPDDEEALNDADGGNEDAEDDDTEAVINNKGEAFIVRVGQSVRLPCSVADNVVLQWKKDDSLYFLGSLKTPVVPAKVTLENKGIIVTDVDASDVGVYTCEVAGKHTYIQHTISIEERATVENLSATNGGQVREGMDVEISCSAKGSPPPTLMWSKETLNGENVRLKEKNVEFSANKIVIRAIKQDQAGTYICYADNRIPPRGDARSINIVVLGKPYVRVHKQTINTKIGVEAILQCTAHEKPESILRWYKDGRPVEDVSSVYTIRAEGQHSNLTIVPRLDTDFGTYTCVAENTYGAHNKSVALVQEPVVEDLSVDGAKLKWTIHSHLPLTEVELQLKDYNGSEWRSISLPVPAPQSSNHTYLVMHEVAGLSSGTYVATARARNDRWSERSKPVEVHIAPQEAASVVRASVFGNGALSVQPASVILSTTLMYILIRFL